MVVEYLVSKVPFSDHIPVINKFSPTKKQPGADGDKEESSRTSSRLASSGTDDEEYSENDEIRPIEFTNPKDRIHEKLMNTRNKDINGFAVVDDENIFDTPRKGNNHLSFVDNSSTMTVSQRLARRKSRKVTDQGSPVCSTFSGSSKTLVGSSGTKDGDEDSEEDKQNRIEEYLENQNNKFDELISKNIDVVLNPDSEKSENEKLIRMVYDNRKPIMRTLYDLGKSEVSSRLPYIPYFNPKTNNENETVKVEIMSYTAETKPSLLGSPFTDYCQQVIDNDSNEPFIEEPNSDQHKNDQERFDELMSHLDSEIKVDIFIDSLEDETKVMLYELLKHDLKDYHHDGEFKNLYHSKNVSPLDKLQVFVIISIKLVFTGLKLFIPITKYLIYKFKENQLYIFNKKNMERLIDLVLTFMNYLDAKLTNNEDIIDKMYKQDYVKAEEVYNDFTSYTTDFFKPSSIKKMLISEDDHVAGNVYDFIVGRITSKDKKRYAEDPRYAKFYSSRRHIIPDSDEVDATEEVELGTEDDEYEENNGFRTTAISGSVSENSISSCTSSAGDPSLFKAAEKFFDEM